VSADEELLAEILELVKQHTGAKTVTAETLLYRDLGVTGDDAVALLDAFTTKYGVDLSAFVWGNFFDDEGGSAAMLEPALVLAASILSPTFAVRWQAARDAEREISVAHLAKVARARVWIDPDASFQRENKLNALGLIFSVLATATMAFLVLLGGVVVYGFLTGELGDQKILVLIGIVAMGLMPIYLAFASWRQIQRKLDLAPRV